MRARGRLLGQRYVAPPSDEFLGRYTCHAFDANSPPRPPYRRGLLRVQPLAAGGEKNAPPRQIEREGSEDREELREALEVVRRLLEDGQHSEVMQRHERFTGALMQALIGFATQAVAGG